VNKGTHFDHASEKPEFWSRRYEKQIEPSFKAMSRTGGKSKFMSVKFQVIDLGQAWYIGSGFDMNLRNNRSHSSCTVQVP